MCMTDKMSSENKGSEYKKMGHMGMGHHMGWVEQRSFPLIGDKFPQMDVKTTQGMIKLPDDFSGKVVRPFQPSSRLHARLHNGVRSL